MCHRFGVWCLVSKIADYSGIFGRWHQGGPRASARLAGHPYITIQWLLQTRPIHWSQHNEQVGCGVLKGPKIARLAPACLRTSSESIVENSRGRSASRLQNISSMLVQVRGIWCDTPPWSWQETPINFSSLICFIRFSLRFWYCWFGNVSGSKCKDAFSKLICLLLLSWQCIGAFVSLASCLSRVVIIWDTRQASVPSSFT